MDTSPECTSRVMALAGPGEVLLSASTVALLEGTNLEFADAGEHELKGLQGRRQHDALPVAILKDVCQ